MREARGLSIEEVSKATKIGIDYIRALEAGDYESLPADIYVRGFIKSYGQLLEADLEELNARYEAARPKPKARRIFSGKLKDDLPYESPIPKSGGLKRRGLPFRIRLNATTVIIAVVIIVSAILLIRSLTNRKGRIQPPITSVNELIEPDSISNGSKLVSPLTLQDLTQEIRLQLGDINPAWALGRADSLTLSIHARQKTWALVETDYRRAFRGDIERDETMEFVAKNAFFMTISNPSVVHLRVNGFDLAEWPERTYPMDLEITRANVLQLLEGAEQVSLPRPPRPNIIGAPAEEEVDSVPEPPPLRTRGITVGSGELRDTETPSEGSQ